LPDTDENLTLRDLDELFVLRTAEKGSAAARRWYYGQCLSFALRLGWETLRAPLGRSSWIRDMQYAARGFRRAPGFSIATVLTLALGIGATTTVFSLAYPIWLKPLPYGAPEELISFRDVYKDRSGWGVSVQEIGDLRELRSISGAAVYGYSAVITKVDEEPVRLTGYYVSVDLFSVLGVRPALGRFFTAEDESGEGGQVIVLSDELWRRRLHADPRIIGTTLEFYGQSHTVVGVAAPDFQFPQAIKSDFWRPLNLRGELPSRNQRYYQAVGRLKAGRTLADLEAELPTLSKRLEGAYPESNRDWSVTASSLVENTVGGYRTAFKFLLVTVGLLLLIACANIASLFLARNTARRNELAVRAALGAGRARLTRQLFAESLFLSLAGGGAGLLLARFGTAAVARMMPDGTPRLAEVAISWPVVLFAFLISVLTGVLCALAPSSRLSTITPGEAMRSDSRTAAGGIRNRLQNGLVIGEVAVSLMLLIGAGLMLKSFFALVNRDRGFEPERTLTLHLQMPFENYGTNDLRIAAYRRIFERLGQLPGVEAVGAVTGFPGSGFGVLGLAPIAADPANPGRRVTMVFHASTPDYFRAMGVPMVTGRGFTEQDRIGMPNVIVVNRAAAAQLWPGDNPIGKTISLPPVAVAGTIEREASFEVIGVVGDMRLNAEASPEAFVATYQVPLVWMDLLIRTAAPAAQIGPVRQALKEIDREFLIEDIAPIKEVMGDLVALPKTQSVLGALFGTLAGLLAAIGLYSLLSYLVGQRLREISIRMALGAGRGDVFRIIVARGMALTLVGTAIGSAGAYALIRLMRSRVFGLKTLDPAVFGGAVALLLGAAFLACYLPARRATQADPVTTLR
ncbi:MAG: ABC transporter permease, partial [Gemmatimonadales bacterium]|nr:ABC transporter permease [Gemmatimonadales bacterium]